MLAYYAMNRLDSVKQIQKDSKHDNRVVKKYSNT